MSAFTPSTETGDHPASELLTRTETTKRDVWMTSASGKQLFILAPRAQDIELEDIAHHLSLVCRWGGATREFYSVAQHSIYVASLVAPANRRWAMLHDASEYVLGDVVSKLKRWTGMANYRAIEALWQTHIYHRFGLHGDVPLDVQHADTLVAIAEAQDLLREVPAHFPPEYHDRTNRLPLTIEPWPPARAKANFLTAFAKA